ncbi:hypothetical protein [Streptomyces triticirhizae]|nr:hypothetical protein [Streptomyces triticirhizae]
MANAVRERQGPTADVSVVTLPAGEAVRCRRQETSDDTRELGQRPERPNTLVDFHLPIPNSGGWLVLTFSTPIPELVDPLADMFDAIADSLRWTEATRPDGGRDRIAESFTARRVGSAGASDREGGS